MTEAFNDRKRFIVLSLCRAILLGVWAALIPAGALASLKIITLNELVQKSDVIARGELTAATSSQHAAVASLKITSVLKGKDLKANSTLPLCNQKVDSEHPDLATVSGDYVIFLARKGECFYPVWGYDALVVVRNGRASTAGIEDQPSDQPIEQFLGKVRSSVHRHVHDAQ
jgi:hypothetical protein